MLTMSVFPNRSTLARSFGNIWEAENVGKGVPSIRTMALSVMEMEGNDPRSVML